MRIGLCQINPTVGALADNAARIITAGREAHQRGVDLAVAPELAISGYPPEDLILKDHFVRDCMEKVALVARGLPDDVSMLVGTPWLDGAGSDPDIAYNAAVYLSGGKIQAVYGKMLLPNYGVFDEKRVFQPGREPLVIELQSLRIAVHICEDSWITDEGPCAALAGEPVDLIVNLSASPYYRGKLGTRCEVLGRAARALGCPLAYCNLVGGQDELVFDGASFVLDPKGNRISAASHFEEDLLIFDLPHSASDGLRQETPLEKEAEVYHALKTGLRDYVDKNGFQRVVIALSGGIDSALVAVLAVDALGAGRVVGLTMPSPYSSSGTRSDAEALAVNLGIEFHSLPIESLFAASTACLQPFWPDQEPGTTEENLQARIRGLLVMAFSNKFGWLVLTTGNKSEVAVGYCTLYGDMVGGFAVIKDVPKTLVFDLCRWRNRESGGAVIPPGILTRPPSAELRPCQKDTDSLPPYEVLDAILELYVEQDQGVEEIAERGFDAALVMRVLQMVDTNEYKRRQSAPGIKITPKAFGRDRRLPITNRYRQYVRNRLESTGATTS
jgi:NAD+ synthase (glutamine-hydrolysing)